MSKLGRTLYEARIEKGYTLNSLQQMTKIQKKYLEAIEEGRFEEIPGNFYLRAFVKQYADIVGLNGDGLLVEYHDELEAVQHGVDEYEEDIAILPSRLARLEEQPETIWMDRFKHYIPTALLVIVLIGLMGFIAMAILRMNQTELEAKKTESSSASTTLVSTVAPESAVSVSKPVASTASESKPLADGEVQVGGERMMLISSEGEETTYELTSPMSKYKFTAKGKGYVWVGVFQDDAMTLDTTIVEGETIDLKIKDTTKRVQVRVGYTEGVDILINNKVIKNTNQYFPVTMSFVLGKNVPIESSSAADGTISSNSAEQGDESVSSDGDE